MIILNKSPLEIIDIIREKDREIDAVLALCNAAKATYKGAMQQYQACCLYSLAKPYNSSVTRILEIGTGLGYSTSFLAQACPDATIVSLGISQEETQHARNIINNNLGFKNVDFKVVSSSWDYYTKDDLFDIIFVDGDHAKISKDLIWYNNLFEDGLMIFHDYTPKEVKVYAALNDMKTKLDKDQFDVLIVDDVNIGMAGFYKRETT